MAQLTLSHGLIAELLSALELQLSLSAQSALQADDYDKKLVDDITAGIKCAEKLFEISEKIAAQEPQDDGQESDLVEIVNRIEDRIEALANERSLNLGPHKETQ